MDTRELLELAAKAAGYALGKMGAYVNDCGDICPAYWNETKKIYWNPLEDDGDALRLTVKLTLEVDVCQTGVAVRTPTGVKVLVDSKEEPNAYAATRRAIVRAAAEIGRAMP